jgi:hypothetical protein
MKRRFPRLLMVDSLNPSMSFRKAQTLPCAKVREWVYGSIDGESGG